ncbi:hypothetical protein G7Y89_g12654 [Cudoniella acicularis]|uniref:3'-5' exonuclease domain-containing protein n=1 Tax=Cudoniella acicularis TaxID=354080 RepID=A0A8H4VWT3_9HELO|nr:hypothetical protein G7Y89_g12654 [Cudoniella acicularis]
MADNLSNIFIDTAAGISTLVDEIIQEEPQPPTLYVDLEGTDLGRKASKVIYLISVHALGGLAFTTPGNDTPMTLKDILEPSSVTKVFFDVRNGSNALYTHFNVSLEGIVDVQLMENRARRSTIKDRGEILFKPQNGGAYEVFSKSPLRDDIKAYCVGDVQYLPRLREIYDGKLSAPWKEKVSVKTQKRVLESQQAGFDPEGDGKAFSPWGR